MNSNTPPLLGKLAMPPTSPIPASTPLVSMCVCTYKRPAGITRTVESLLAQKIPPGWDTEIIIVDNDRDLSAASIIQKLQNTKPKDLFIKIRYINESRPGVSHARNRCLDEAQGELIAFIDDDEYAEPTWLMNLWSALQTSKADAVFGPVLPVFEKIPPQWLLDSGQYISSPSIATLDPIHWTASRAGSVLFRRQMIDKGQRFSSHFSKTGGEDTFFFASHAKAGCKLIWCNEALVHETVPANRMSKSWYLSRCLNDGRTYVRLQAKLGQSGFSAAYYLLYALYGLLYGVILLVPVAALWMLRHPLHMRFAGKLAGNIGKIASYFHGSGHYGGGQ